MKKLFTGLFLGGLLTLFAVPVLAQSQGPLNGFLQPGGQVGANVNLPGSGQYQQDSFVNVVKGFLNRGLSMLGLLALIMFLYGGFIMVTAGTNKQKYDQGWKVIKYATGGLILIGVSRFIVSGLFWFVNLITTNAQPAGTGG